MSSALEEDRDFLLRSLEDLEREWAAGDLAEADYRTLKDDYTARAAAVLRALEDGDEAAVDLAAAGPGVDPGPDVVVVGPRRRRRSLALAVALVVFAGAAGAVVARSAGERLPGDPATGSIAETGPSASVARGLADARRLIGEGKTLEAIKVYDGVLERDARQPEALAYRGWLLRLAGKAAGDTSLIDKGMEFIERAVAADPSYPDARFFRAFVLFQDRGDPAAAVPELRAFLANDPPRAMVPVVEDLLKRALTAAQAPSTAPGPTPTPTPAPPPG